jgi:branched-chain amino acid transport system permease protein
MKNKFNIAKWILIGVGAVAVLGFPFVATTPYQIHILNLAGIYILLSLGLNLAMGFGGQFNLAMGALWGVGSYTAAILNTKVGTPFWLTLPAAMLVTGLIGALVGLPSLKVRSHYLAIVTIGLGQVINILMLNLEDLTGGALGIGGIQKPALFGFTFGDDQSFYYLILVIVILGFLIARQIVGHRIGRAFRAIRDDYQAAKAMGVNTAYYQILAFAISAVYAGAAGALFAHLNSYISPDIYEFKSTLFVMTMTMVGGMGSLTGSIVGGLALPVLNEYLRVFLNWQRVAYGLSIMIVVLFMPGGVIELTRRMRSSRKIRWPWSRMPVENKSLPEEPHVS